MFSNLDVQQSRCSASTIYSNRNVQQSRCSAITMFIIHDVQHFRCPAFTMFNIHDVQHSRCSASTMFSDYDLQRSRPSAIQFSGNKKIKPRSFKSSENSNETGNGPYQPSVKIKRFLYSLAATRRIPMTLQRCILISYN